MDLGLYIGMPIGGGYGIYGAVYSFLAALNASQSQPLTAATGSNPTTVATSAVTAPFYLTTIAAGTTLQTIPAGYPVVPNSRVTWDTALGAVAGSDVFGGKGTFDDAAYWSAVNVSIASSKATFSGGTANISKTTVTTIGEKYTVSYNLTVRAGGIYQTGFFGTTKYTTSGPKSYQITALSTTFQLASDGASTDLDIDDLTVVEITPAYLPTDSAAAALATGTTLTSGLTRYASGPAGNPTLAVLCEPSGTNLALQSNTFSNASWVKSNITPTQNAVGPDGVTNSAWTLVAGADNGTMLQTITSASATRNMAIYLKRKTGTGAISLTVDNGSTYTTKTLDGTWQRFDITQAAVTNPVFGLKMATNTDEIYAYQVDLCSNSVANTPVTTTTGTVTRNARYETILGAELGNKFNAQIYSNEALGAGARDMRLFSDGTRMLTYQGAAGLLVFRDESQVMGSDLITVAADRDFSSDTGYWTKTAGDVSIADGVCHFTGGSGRLRRSAFVSAGMVGKTYKITYTVKNRVSGDIRYQLGGVVFGTVRNANGTYTEYTTAVAAGTIEFFGTSPLLDIDDISVQEVAELTAAYTLAAGTPAVIAVDASTTAWTMAADGTQVATATAPGAATWGTTVYVGSSTSGSAVLNGGISVIQSSADSSWDEGSLL